MRKLPIEVIENRFNKEGFVLADRIYKSVNHSMNVICPMGHACRIRPSDFKAGTRCTTCSKKKKRSIEELVPVFAKEGYALISKEYKNALKTKLKTICPVGHIYEVTWGGFQTGSRCSDCYGNKKKTLEEICVIFEKENYKVLSDKYVNAHVDLIVLCPKNHENEINYDDFCSGKRCLICKDTRASIAEKELFNKLREQFPDLLKRCFSVTIPNRPYIHWFESDIFDPKTKRGIEYDGIFSHSFKGLKWGRKHWPDEALHSYHQIKDSALLTYHEVTLFHIKEEDWKLDKQACFDKCVKFLSTGQKDNV
jgi:hypothetical protein